MKTGRLALGVLLAMCLGLSGNAQAPKVANVTDPTKFIKDDDVATLCQKLVRIRSDYDEGVLANHREMAQFLGGELRALGFDVNIIEPEPNYPTVIGRLRGTERKPVFGMIAHYNTVAVGDTTKWTDDPFSGLIKDGRVYGRGSADQKMALTSALIGTKAIIDAGIKLRGDLVLLFIPGEGAQTHSLPYILKDKPELLKADWYLDTEGGNDIVKIAGGWVWAKVTVTGTTGHTGGTAAGGKGRPVNAAYKLAKVLMAIEDVDTWMTYKKHPLFPAPEYDGKPVVEVGKIQGGYKVNQVPDVAEAQIDIRLLPGQSPDGALGEMRALFAKMKQTDPALDAKVEAMTTQWVPMKYWDTLTDDDPVVKAIRELAPAATGHTPGWTGSIGGGRPDLWAVGAKWINWGFSGGGANAHAPNEYATIEGGVKRAQLFTKLILKVIGPEAVKATADHQ